MRSRLIFAALSFYLAFAALGCTSKPTSNSTTDSGTPTDAATGNGDKDHKQGTDAKDVQKKPIVVPPGTSVTVRLGSAIGSRLSQPGQTFNGTVAKDVLVESVVAIPQGATVTGTVTDAKPLGKFAGGAVLQVRLDSINLNGADLPVHAALRTFSVKGKGKRTGVMAGGGAVLGGIVGAIAGGGKGAAVGMAAGGGAGAGGSALSSNKDIVLPAESAVSFQLSQPFEVSP